MTEEQAKELLSQQRQALGELMKLLADFQENAQRIEELLDMAGLEPLSWDVVEHLLPATKRVMEHAHACAMQLGGAAKPE